MTRVWQLTASSSLITLIALCLLWEGWLAPLRAGGSLLILKAVPLLLPLRGVLRGRRYTYQWACMAILFYFTEGVVRVWTDTGLSAWLAAFEVMLTLIFFTSAIRLVRLSAPDNVSEQL